MAVAVLAGRLQCRAAAGDSGGGGSGGEQDPKLSEEELQRMEDDFLKEFVSGLGADDPESLKYKSKVKPDSVDDGRQMAF